MHTCATISRIHNYCHHRWFACKRLKGLHKPYEQGAARAGNTLCHTAVNDSITFEFALNRRGFVVCWSRLHPPSFDSVSTHRLTVWAMLFALPAPPSICPMDSGLRMDADVCKLLTLLCVSQPEVFQLGGRCTEDGFDSPKTDRQPA